MISLENCKKLIEDKTISDKEMDDIRNSLYELAELTWDIYKDKKYGSKNPLWLLHDKD